MAMPSNAAYTEGHAEYDATTLRVEGVGEEVYIFIWAPLVPHHPNISSQLASTNPSSLITNLNLLIWGPPLTIFFIHFIK